MVPLEITGTTAGELVKSAITDLSSQVTAVIPAALGLAVIVFGARYLWGVVKRLSH